jgi:hypothetical protein
MGFLLLVCCCMVVFLVRALACVLVHHVQHAVHPVSYSCQPVHGILTRLCQAFQPCADVLLALVRIDERWTLAGKQPYQQGVGGFIGADLDPAQFGPCQNEDHLRVAVLTTGVPRRGCRRDRSGEVLAGGVELMGQLNDSERRPQRLLVRVRGNRRIVIVKD